MLGAGIGIPTSRSECHYHYLFGATIVSPPIRARNANIFHSLRQRRNGGKLPIWLSFSVHLWPCSQATFGSMHVRYSDQWLIGTTAISSHFAGLYIL